MNSVAVKLDIIGLFKKMFWDVEEPEIPEQDAKIAKEWASVLAEIDGKEATLTDGGKEKNAKGKSSMAKRIEQKVVGVSQMEQEGNLGNNRQQKQQNNDDKIQEI